MAECFLGGCNGGAKVYTLEDCTWNKFWGASTLEFPVGVTWGKIKKFYAIADSQHYTYTYAFQKGDSGELLYSRRLSSFSTSSVPDPEATSVHIEAEGYGANYIANVVLIM